MFKEKSVYAKDTDSKERFYIPLVAFSLLNWRPN